LGRVIQELLEPQTERYEFNEHMLILNRSTHSMKILRDFPGADVSDFEKVEFDIDVLVSRLVGLIASKAHSDWSLEY